MPNQLLYAPVKYGTAVTIPFSTFTGAAFSSTIDWAHASLSAPQISKDGGAFTGTSNDPTEIAAGSHEIALTAAEMQAARIQITATDDSGGATGPFDDVKIILLTYGDSSAFYRFGVDQVHKLQQILLALNIR